MTRVVITGAYGRMGREVIKGILSADDFTLVGAVDVNGVGEDIGPLIGFKEQGILISDNLDTELQNKKPDILIDFTTADVGFLNCFNAILHGVSPVSGTTGMSDSQIEQLRMLCAEKQIGAVLAPNFALGAVIMMRLAGIAAQYFPDVEIIELHHDQKIDAPSGTSLGTADVILAAQSKKSTSQDNSIEKLKCARGANKNGIHIHSVRLPGLIAHQKVIFGGPGQSLTIRHDSYGRESFIPGVLLAARKVRSLKCLVNSLNELI
jgi:4-hydroxy-tetrahydrodipicolinate reductase